MNTAPRQDPKSRFSSGSARQRSVRRPGLLSRFLGKAVMLVQQTIVVTDGRFIENGAVRKRQLCPEPKLISQSQLPTGGQPGDPQEADQAATLTPLPAARCAIPR